MHFNPQRDGKGVSARIKAFVVAVVVLAVGAAAALAAISADSEPEPTLAPEPTARPPEDASAASPPVEQAPLDLDPWEVTPTNALEPPAGQVPAWALNPEPPEDIAVAMEPPPPPVDPPEPWETPWTETAANPVP